MLFYRLSSEEAFERSFVLSTSILNSADLGGCCNSRSVAASTTSTELLCLHLSAATLSHPDTVPRQYRLKEPALSSRKANLGDRIAHLVPLLVGVGFHELLAR